MCAGLYTLRAFVESGGSAGRARQGPGDGLVGNQPVVSFLLADQPGITRAQGRSSGPIRETLVPIGRQSAARCSL